MKNIRDYLALALDNISERTLLERLIKNTAPYVGVYKFGLEQFTRFGPSILDIVQDTNRKIFLDLKFHDIPNTVAKTVKSACQLNVDFLTIHTQGGIQMMKAAVEAARDYEHRPKLIGVTLLTSIDQSALNNEIKVPLTTGQYVVHLGKSAVEAGLDGLVCSATDLEYVKRVCPDKFEVITPGIRPSGAEINDQKRVATPEWAIKNGSSVLVIGRPITKAEDPENAARTIYKSIEKTLE